MQYTVVRLFYNKRKMRFQSKKNGIRWKRENSNKNMSNLLLTGLTVSRTCTSSTTRLVERRRGNLDKVSSRDICASCSSSFLLSQRKTATRTIIPIRLLSPKFSHFLGVTSYSSDWLYTWVKYHRRYPPVYNVVFLKVEAPTSNLHQKWLNTGPAAWNGRSFS